MLWYPFFSVRSGFMIRFIFRGAVPLLCLFFLLSCSRAGGEGDLLSRCAASDASFVAVFPPAYEGGEAVRCGGIRSGDTVTLTAEEPERLAGVRVVLTRTGDGGYRVEIDGPDFPAPAPVDPRAARFLTDVFVLLYGDGGGGETGSVEAASLLLPTVGRSGEETVFRRPLGTVVFGEDGAPVRVSCRDMAGRERTVVLEEYASAGP